VEAFAADEASAEAEFGSREAAGLTSDGFWNTGDFKEHVTREDDCDPKFWSAFTLTHSNFRWTLGDRLVRENSAEDFTLTLEEACDRDTASFNVVIFDPTTFECLQAEVTEVELVATGGDAATVTALLFTIFYSAGKKCHWVEGWTLKRFREAY
jgi:hypothetical protein